MGEMAEASMVWDDDEFYEERSIVEDYARGLSVSAIAAKYDMSRSDVIDVLEWARAKDRGEAVMSTWLPQWQPIETIPKEYKDGRQLILCDYYGKVVVGRYSGHFREWHANRGNDYRDDIQPTHWMEMPPAPGK